MDLYNEILHWSLGVITSAEPDDEQLKHALVRGDNMMFTSIASGKARPRTRRGLSLMNQTPLSNTSDSEGPAIIGGGHYSHKDGSATNYTIVVQENGDVHLMIDDATSSDLTTEASHVALLSNDIGSVSIAPMNNRIFLLDDKAGQASLKGLDTVAWGTPIPENLALGAQGTPGFGAMNGEYEILVTGWDNEIANESDRSAIESITLADESLQISVSSVDVSETNRFFRVYIRKAVLGSGFYRVTSGTNYNATEQGFPLYNAGPLAQTIINLNDAAINNLILTPPPLGAHGLPPATGKYAVVFERRLFVADDEGVWWSELDKPDAFNALSYEPIKSRDPRGGDVTGLHVWGGRLHIFTETARVTLTGGTDLRSWIWETPDVKTGAVAHAAIASHENLMAWWDKEIGPVGLNADEEQLYIGHDRIRAQVSSSVLNSSEVAKVRAAAGDGRVVFAVPEVSQQRRTKMFSFHSELMTWESTRWDPMDIGALFVSVDEDKDTVFYLGNYNGQLFRFLRGENDGVRSGTMRGTFVASGNSVSSIADAGASFDVSGAGLLERKVTILDSDGIPLTGTQRPRIIANTATSVTLSDAVSGLEDGATYTYLIGGPDLVLETYWDHMELPFVLKRFDRVFFEMRADQGAAEVNLAVAVSFDSTQTRDVNVDAELTDAAGGIWDISDWDSFYWDGPSEVAYSLPVIKSGRNYRIQLRSPYPDQGVVLLKVAMLAHRRADRFRRAY